MSLHTNYHGRFGWMAESDMPLDNERILRLTTRKSSAGPLVTRAAVHRLVDGRLKHLSFYDFHKAVFSDNLIRVTEGAVTDQHKRVIATLIDSIRADAIRYYSYKFARAA